MQQFLYIKKENKKGMFPIFEIEAKEPCVFCRVYHSNRLFDRYTAAVLKRKQLPIFSEIILGNIPIYQPHKKLYYNQLGTVIRKVGRRLNTDFSKLDLGILCQTAEQAIPLLSRLTAPVIWVFCSQKGYSEEDASCPVFFSREVANVRRLPAVIALTEHEGLELLSPKTVLFNLTEQNFKREYTINDAWGKLPASLQERGIPRPVLNSILFDLNQVEKVSALQWG